MLSWLVFCTVWMAKSAGLGLLQEGVPGPPWIWQGRAREIRATSGPPSSFFSRPRPHPGPGCGTERVQGSWGWVTTWRRVPAPRGQGLLLSTSAKAGGLGSGEMPGPRLPEHLARHPPYSVNAPPPPFRSGRGRPFSLPVRQHGDNRVEGEARAASRPRRNGMQIFLRWRVPSPSGRFPPRPARPGSLRAPKARFLLLLPSRRVARGRRRRGEGGGGAWTRASGHLCLAHLHLSSSHHPRPPSSPANRPVLAQASPSRLPPRHWNEFRSGDL